MNALKKLKQQWLLLSKKQKAALLFLLFFLIILPLTLASALNEVRTRSKATTSNLTGSTGRLNKYSCTKLTLSPSGPVYLPGETVSITYADSNSPHASNINIYYAEMSSTQSDQYSSLSLQWNLISNISYNSSSGIGTGSFTLPQKDAEYIIVVNVSGDAQCNDGSRQMCGGSPLYTGAPNGVCLGGSFTLANPIGCNGCQKIIAVDSLRDVQIQENYLDLKEYWNLDPGNYWQYSGVNYSYNPNKTYLSRIDVEQEVSLNQCGNPVHRVIPMRFSKNTNEGYWAPQNSGQSGGRWSGWIGLRWFVTNFANDPYWNSNFNGSFAAKTYCVVGQTPINNVCPSPTGNFTSLFKEFGEVIQNTTLISTTDTQHNYFAPYFLGPRYLPNRPSVFYEFDRKDKLHVSGLESTLCNTIPTTYQYNDRIWHLDISNTTVNTPAYTGPALRYRFLEGILPQGGVISTILREDWFLTKDIGVVRIDQVPAISLSGGPLNTYDKFLASCRANSACLGNNNNIVSPNSSMSLTSFFDISQTPLIPSANTEGTTTITVGQNQNWNLLVKTRNNTLYTGWIDLQSPNTKKWQWIENGTLTIQESGTIGSYTYRIRPNLKETPSQYETKIGSNNLPWSRIIIINVITLPIGTITGPTSVRKNTAAAYTATANSIVNNLQKVEIYATSINSQQWQLLGRKTNCSGYICTLTVNWTPTQTGLYYIVLNAYNQNGQRCSGNVNPNSACQYFIKDLWNVCHSNSWNQCDPESEDIILVDVIP